MTGVQQKLPCGCGRTRTPLASTFSTFCMPADHRGRLYFTRACFGRSSSSVKIWSFWRGPSRMNRIDNACSRRFTGTGTERRRSSRSTRWRYRPCSAGVPLRPPMKKTSTWQTGFVQCGQPVSANSFRTGSFLLKYYLQMRVGARSRFGSTSVPSWYTPP